MGKILGIIDEDWDEKILNEVCKHAPKKGGDCKYYNSGSVICNEYGGHWGTDRYCGVLKHYYGEGKDKRDVSGKTNREKRGEEETATH